MLLFITDIMPAEPLLSASGVTFSIVLSFEMLRMCFYIMRNLTANFCLVNRNLVNLANQVTIYLYWMGFKQSSTNLLFFLRIFLLFAHIFYIYNIHCIIYVCVAHAHMTFTHMHIWLRVVPSLSLLPHKRMKQKLPCLALKKGNKNTLGSLVYSWFFFFISVEHVSITQRQQRLIFK